MLILHDPDTLTHETVELIGARLIPALESPERIKTILETLAECPHHEVQQLSFKSLTSHDKKHFFIIIQKTHEAGYVDHLEHAHANWVKAGHIEPHESILPECFPFPTNKSQEGHPPPPKDIFALTGYYAFDMSSGIMASTHQAVMASASLAYRGAYMLATGMDLRSTYSCFDQ